MRYFPSTDDIADHVADDKRVANRVDVRNGDGLSARLCLANGGELELRVYNISLSGVSVVATIEEAEVILEGQVYALVLLRAWDVPLKIDAMCVWSAADKNRHRRYGFSFVPDQSNARVAEIDKLRRHEDTRLPEGFDYQQVDGLSNEVKQKLTEARPETLARAGRIPGVTPAAVSLLLIHLKKRGALEAAAPDRRLA